MKRKVIKKTIVVIAIILGVLLVMADIRIMSYGGEYLAGSLIPPLPEDRIKISDVCLTGNSEKCRGINYTTAQSPESVAALWALSGKMIQTSTDPFTGETFYTYVACNHSILGYQYAALYEDFPCAGVSVHYDKSNHATVIHTSLSWTQCLRIIRKYVPSQNRELYRHCYDG